MQFPYLRLGARSILVALLVTLAFPSSAVASYETSEWVQAELDRQYQQLRRDLKRRDHIQGLAAQAYHPAALIHESDRDQADVVLRRTAALLSDLQDALPVAVFDARQQELERLRLRNAEIAVGARPARRDLYRQACHLRRRIAFANPLLDFDQILFIKRHRATFNHMCDQYYGINALPDGGLFVLTDPFSDAPAERNLLAGSVVESGRLQGQRLDTGSFLSPDLSYDGKTVLFAYVECEGDTDHRHHTDPSQGHWHPSRSYHLCRVNVDGSQLQQVTDGTWNDFDPCWLPNGRIVFISERRGGYLRCGRVCPTYTLYDMNPDGSDIRCLSPHETNEWHPSVTHQGLIIYTRWDYVDRHGCVAHHPWTTTPDGRDSRAVHGNFSPREARSDMELDIRAVPGSHTYVATGAPHHGQAFGSLVVVDPRIQDDDAMAPVKRLTPEVDFPETQEGGQVYGTPWPLSDTYFLCVYDANMAPGAGNQGGEQLRGDYGIYLLDAFGNKELIYRDPDIACQSPMPLRARKSPPVIAEIPRTDSDEATLALVNVYDSLKPWPEDTPITHLRVYQIIPMSVPSGAPPHEVGMRLPGLEGADSVILARYVLGTTPVEADGSAHFVVPANKELFFQALDEHGLAVQSMRSSTYLRPGERLTCQGCHELKKASPQAPQGVPIAFQRGALPLTPDVDGTNPFSYPRLVQPVLDKNCLPCHQKNPDKAPRLDSGVIVNGNQKWYASYHSLAPKYGFWQYGDRHRTTPGQFGAKAAKLYAMLEQGHHSVRLSAEDLHRITLWLDSASIFYGVYEKEGGEAQLRGEIVYPTLE